MQQKIAECTDKIRDLGSLPSDSFDKYHSMPSKQLFKQLEKANSELKKYRYAFSFKPTLDHFYSLIWFGCFYSFFWVLAHLNNSAWCNWIYLWNVAGIVL